ncbi:nucleic acid-binding protein [Candidatus Scalindua japonica]|uniref:Nucleic acid-binding protein n=1 Tax=Candidatus Scalindua japonica TaxID=1284222 RepID=A0A286TZ41_9BACT|nr:type II toxin-antitoxin system VapC family toxin [Candidatus Scalindua japonica]GAX61155.1 nucleic acid-binding protein [Candidatus Scalindua japonica]
MKKFLIDSDILIDFLRGIEGARNYLSILSKDATLCCSVITIAEIYAGMRKTEEKKTTTLLDGLFSIPISEEIARIAGEFKRDTKSQKLELDNCLIAATALAENAVLATKNLKHYPMKKLNLESPGYHQ